MKWIKCTKELPKNGQECLVGFHLYVGQIKQIEAGYCFSLATFTNGEFYSWELRKTIGCVSHWMPLPKPPKTD